MLVIVLTVGYSFSLSLWIVVYMQNPENLVVFSAGNDGEYTDRDMCTISTPGMGKVR